MMKKICYMFPGQGSQAVGMGKELYELDESIKNTYDATEQLLDIPLVETMFNGPKEKLTSTYYAQPALLLASTAIVHYLKKEGISPYVTVGHSLGEYSALVASHVLDLEDALPLVYQRGLLMEEAYPKGKGAMAAVLGMEEAEIKTALENELDKEEIVNLANFNCPGQIVISGTKQGIEKAAQILKNSGARRVQILQVSGPFHSELMKPASKKFEDYLNKVQFNRPNVPVYMNVTALPTSEVSEIKQLLVKQLYSPVRFSQSIKNIIDREEIDCFVEIGHGKVLSGLIRRIDRSIPTFQIQDEKSLAKFIEWYKED